MVPTTAFGVSVGVGRVAVAPLVLTPESLVLSLQHQPHKPLPEPPLSDLSARSGPLSVHPGGPVPLCKVRPVGFLEASNPQPSQDGLHQLQGCCPGGQMGPLLRLQSLGCGLRLRWSLDMSLSLICAGSNGGAPPADPGD